MEVDTEVAASDPQEVERTECQTSKMGPPVTNPKPSFLVRFVKKAPDVTRSVGVIVTVLVLGGVFG